MKPLLCIDNLNVSYNKKEVLKDINLSVKKGEILAIVGESGSGKSTLLKSIQGILSSNGRITGGSIKFNDTELTNLSGESMRKIRGKSLSMIFQDAKSSLCPIRTIEKQFIETVRCHENASIKDIRQRAVSIFSEINLKDGERIMKSYPFELSGGMNQRVAIALSIIENPDLILADEPTSALDVTAQSQVVKTLVNLNKKRNTAIIIVTHNIRAASCMADNIAVMYRGSIVEYGKKKDVLSSPKHPYTIMLVNSTPYLKNNRISEQPEAAVSLEKAETAVSLEKTEAAVSMERSETGCPFASRCSMRLSKCRYEKPNYICIDNRKIACHLFQSEDKEDAV